MVAWPQRQLRCGRITLCDAATTITSLRWTPLPETTIWSFNWLNHLFTIDYKVVLELVLILRRLRWVVNINTYFPLWYLCEERSHPQWRSLLIHKCRPVWPLDKKIPNFSKLYEVHWPSRLLYLTIHLSVIYNPPQSRMFHTAVWIVCCCP